MFSHPHEVSITAPADTHFAWADGSPITVNRGLDSSFSVDTSTTGCDTLILEDEGFVRRYRLEKSFNGLVILNIFTWWIGALCDDAAGSTFKYDPVCFLKPDKHRPDTLDVAGITNTISSNPVFRIPIAQE
jgi:hypothetical protein